MCKHCHGLGRTYTEPFPGVWQIEPCSLCEEERLKRHEENMRILNKRLEEAYERFGIRSESCCGD